MDDLQINEDDDQTRGSSITDEDILEQFQEFYDIKQRIKDTLVQ